MIARKKVDSKTISQQKKSRRKLLTFFRIVKYGVDNFIRNSWLSVAATAVMTVTLLIVFVVFASRIILIDTVSELSNNVSMSIYLKTETTDKAGEDLVLEASKLSSVRSVTYCGASCARDKFAQTNKDDIDALAALNNATNAFPATLSVIVVDINDTTQLEDFVNNNSLVLENLSTDHAPSFAGERKSAIQTIGRAVNFIQQLGVVIGSVFVVISSLIIFNTIRMAIFNRREEIQMMKLIGADKSFIRGPFLIEAIIYGLIAAVVATGLGIWGLFSSSSTLASYDISVTSTIGLANSYWPLLIVAMIVVGSIVGVVSSLLATRRYLKI
jgi:cell division transport system permease protein